MGRIKRYKIYLILACILCGWEAGTAGQNSWTSQGPAVFVNALLFQQQRADGLYAAAADGLYHSEDGGANWRLVEGTLAGNNVLSLAATPQHIYAGLNRGLYRSADNGVTWFLADAPGPGILALAATADQVYAGTFGRGVFASADGGDTWRPGEGALAGELDGALAGAIVFSLAVAPQDERTVYAGTAAGLFVSRDGGANWAVLGGALAGFSVRTIYVSNLDPGTILVGTFEAGIWRSLDGGQEWTPINNGLSDLAVRSLAVDPRSPALLYAATSSGGFFRSKDGGEQWLPINTGLPGLGARTVVIDPAQAERLVGGGPGPGVWTISFAPEARLDVDQSIVDFGAVGVGQVARQLLHFTNLGGAPLEISALFLGRLSAFSVVESSGIVVAPGESQSVELRYQPQARLAARDTLSIHSNDPAFSVTEVMLRGIGVEAELRVDPQRVDFGPVRIGEFKDTTVVLTNAGNAPLNLENAFFEHTAFRVLGFAAGILPPGGIGRIETRFVPLLTGGVRSTLVVLSDAPNQRRLEVTFDGTGTAPELSIVPGELDFGNVDLSRTRTLELEISNSGNTLLTIARFELEGGSFRINEVAPLALEPGVQQVLTVSFLPLQSGTQIDTLVLASDAPGQAGRRAVALRGLSLATRNAGRSRQRSSGYGSSRFKPGRVPRYCAGGQCRWPSAGLA